MGVYAPAIRRAELVVKAPFYAWHERSSERPPETAAAWVWIVWWCAGQTGGATCAVPSVLVAADAPLPRFSPPSVTSLASA